MTSRRRNKRGMKKRSIEVLFIRAPMLIRFSPRSLFAVERFRRKRIRYDRTVLHAPPISPNFRMKMNDKTTEIMAVRTVFLERRVALLEQRIALVRSEERKAKVTEADTGYMTGSAAIYSLGAKKPNISGTATRKISVRADIVPIDALRESFILSICPAFNLRIIQGANPSARPPVRSESIYPTE